MFDISFAELMMIAVVALLVVGPEKLPQVARIVGAFVGRLQRYVAQVKEEINREARFEALQNLQQEIKQGVNKVESSMMAGANELKETLTAAEKSIKPKGESTTKTPTIKTKLSTSSKKPSAKNTAVKKSVSKKEKPKKTKGQT